MQLTFKALQRRYQNLERDLKPLEDRMQSIKSLGNDIMHHYPRHKSEVEKAMNELEGLCVNLMCQFCFIH